MIENRFANVIDYFVDLMNLENCSSCGHKGIKKVKIDDVLKKIASNGLWKTSDNKNIRKLINLWGKCQYKSLDEIFSGDLMHHFCSGKKYPCNGTCNKPKERLKDPSAQALLEFLETLINKS